MRSPMAPALHPARLEYAFRTERYAITVTIHDDGTWSYDQQTTLIVRGQAEPFQHTDRARLKWIDAPTPNPRARCVATHPIANLAFPATSCRNPRRLSVM